MNAFDHFFMQQSEPNKSCLLALKSIVLEHHHDISSAWKYGMPFFYFKGKMLCYLWTNKKTGQTYIGFADGNKMDAPELIQEKRSRMKIFLIDAEKDLPVKKIKGLLKLAMEVQGNK